MESNQSPHSVDYGIDGSDFMKMDLCECGVMCVCFGTGKSCKGINGHGLNVRWEGGVLYQLRDLGEVTKWS